MPTYPCLSTPSGMMIVPRRMKGVVLDSTLAPRRDRSVRAGPTTRSGAQAAASSAATPTSWARLRADVYTEHPPVREQVQARGVGQLHLSRAIWIHEPELEVAGHGPVEHDLLAVERPRRGRVEDGIVGELQLSRAVGVHNADLEVRAAPPAHEDDASAVRGPGGSALFLYVESQTREPGAVRVHGVDLRGNGVELIVGDVVPGEGNPVPVRGPIRIVVDRVGTVGDVLALPRAFEHVVHVGDEDVAVPRRRSGIGLDR